jgi:hypothetical protein
MWLEGRAMKARIIENTGSHLSKSLGFPLNHVATVWTQEGNGDSEWSWHRSDIHSSKGRNPKTHTTRFSLIAYEDGAMGFSVRTTHAMDELKKFLAALIAGKTQTNNLLKQLNRKGYQTWVEAAPSHGQEGFEIRSYRDAERCLNYIKQSDCPWYDNTLEVFEPKKRPAISKWNEHLESVTPMLIQIFWMHYLGDRFWKSSRNVKSVSGKKAHTNTRLRKQLREAEGSENCQNMDCSQRGAATEVAHLDAYKNRNELWNVIFLCRNCHAQQKPQAKCSVKKKSNIKNEYRVSYPPRRSIDRGYWNIKSKHIIK